VQEAVDAEQHSADARDFLLSVKDEHNIKRNHDAVQFKQHQIDAASLSIMVCTACVLCGWVTTFSNIAFVSSMHYTMHLEQDCCKL
jgi:hypothetical protein